MARQLAALPRIPKQFELYRSRKFLSSDSFSAVNVGGKVFKEKLELQLNPDCIHEELKNAEKIFELKCGESKDNHLELLDGTRNLDPFCGNKKRKKPRKSKSDSSESTVKPSVLDNLKPDEGTCDSPCKSGEGDYVKKEDESCETVDKSPSESDYYSAEGGCLPSPTVTSSPPFGFPLATDKLFESAVGLLSKHKEAIPSISTSVTIVPETVSPSSTELLPQSSTKSFASSTSKNNNSRSFQKAASNEVTASDSRTKEGAVSAQNKKQDFIEEFDHAKPELHVESEPVSNDNSNLLAMDEEGWQSQTKRHNKKKKKENAARNVASSEKYNQHLDKLQKKEQNFARHSQHHGGSRLGSDSNYKKNKGNKNLRENRFPSSRKDYEEKCKRWINGETPSAEAVVEESAVGSDICEGEKKSAADCMDSKPKLLSYRDALLKSKSREDLHYSSDSGVDANSVSSSCDSVVPQPELPVSPLQESPVATCCDKFASTRTATAGEASLAVSQATDAVKASLAGGYNHEEVINYLWETWTIVQEKCKRGLVARYNDKREEQVIPSRLSNQAKSRSPGWSQRHRRGKIY